MHMKYTTISKSGINEKNRKLLDALNRSGKNIFSIKDASNIIGLPIKKTSLYLGYLTRRGWLARVKRGLYISVPLGTDNPQEYKENPWIVANRIFSPCYIGGWSAAEHWELTEQIFNSICVVTSRSFRRKNTTIQGTAFLLKYLNSDLYKHMHIKSAWVENVKIQVSDPTQTIVDILDDPSSGGGIRHVNDIVKNYFESGHKDEAKLLAYIGERRNKTIYKRLGYILETLNIPADKVIKSCLKNISQGYSTFDPAIKNKGVYNRRWNLRVNAEIKA
jgi:predicted transcriptional regulator of viral defense system